MASSGGDSNPSKRFKQEEGGPTVWVPPPAKATTQEPDLESCKLDPHGTLLVAIRRGNTASIEAVVQQHPTACVDYDRPSSLLCEAFKIINQDVARAVIKLLLQHGADPNKPLRLLSCVSLLRSRNLDLLLESEKAHISNVDCGKGAQGLLMEIINPQHFNSYFSSQKGNVDWLEYLVVNGHVELNKVCDPSSGHYPLHVACHSNRNKLLKLGADLDVVDNRNHTPLLNMLNNYEAGCAEEFLLLGTSCTVGVTPLMYVEERDFGYAGVGYDMVYTMLDRGASLWQSEYDPKENEGEEDSSDGGSNCDENDEDEDEASHDRSPLGSEYLGKELTKLFLEHSVFVSLTNTPLSL